MLFQIGYLMLLIGFIWNCDGHITSYQQPKGHLIIPHKIWYYEIQFMLSVNMNILKNKTCDMTYHWLEHTWIIHEIDKETSTAGDCNMLNFHSCKTYSMQWYKCPLLPPYYFLDILYIKYMGTSEPETTVDMKSLVCWSPVPYNWGQAVSGVGSRSFCFLELTWQCRYCVRRWRMAFTFFPFFPVLVL